MNKREQAVSLVKLKDKLKQQTSLLELLESKLTALETNFPNEARQVEAKFKDQFRFQWS